MVGWSDPLRYSSMVTSQHSSRANVLTTEARERGGVKQSGYFGSAIRCWRSHRRELPPPKSDSKRCTQADNKITRRSGSAVAQQHGLRRYAIIQPDSTSEALRLPPAMRSDDDETALPRPIPVEKPNQTNGRHAPVRSCGSLPQRSSKTPRPCCQRAFGSPGRPRLAVRASDAVHP